MIIKSSRFGEISCSQEDIITFPRGIPAFEQCREFVIIAPDDSAVKWLQSASEPGLALPVTSPDAVRSDYNARIPDDELKLLGRGENPDPSDLALLVVLTIPNGLPWEMTANLRAPILINLSTRLAVQVIALNEEYPVRFQVFPQNVRSKMKAESGAE